MGRIVTSVTVGNFSEPEHELRFDALIDTGAYCLTLPRAWKERLGAWRWNPRTGATSRWSAT